MPKPVGSWLGSGHCRDSAGGIMHIIWAATDRQAAAEGRRQAAKRSWAYRCPSHAPPWPGPRPTVRPASLAPAPRARAREEEGEKGDNRGDGGLAGQREAVRPPARPRTSRPAAPPSPWPRPRPVAAPSPPASRAAPVGPCPDHVFLFRAHAQTVKLMYCARCASVTDGDA
jgi:hypothetical protein